MTQQRLTRKRCRSVRFINIPAGLVQRGTEGTIGHEMANLDRHIVFVSWDNGLEGYAFPNEIELLTGKEKREAA